MKRADKDIKNIITYIILIFFSVIFLFPIFWIIVSSIKPETLIQTVPPIIRFAPTFEHYRGVVLESNFYRFTINSIVVATFSTLLSLVLGAPAAYSLSRFRLGGKNIDFWILSTRMAPPVLSIIPFYILLRTLGLLNTYTGLILAHTTFNLPFAIWLMRDFLNGIPIDIEEAGLVDGCSHGKAFVRLILPLTAPGLITTAIFCFIFSWNEFLFGLLLTGVETRTLPAAISSFIGIYEISWGSLFSAGVVGIIPVLLVAVFLQRHLVRGLTLGAIK